MGRKGGTVSIKRSFTTKEKDTFNYEVTISSEEMSLQNVLAVAYNLIHDLESHDTTSTNDPSLRKENHQAVG